MQISPQIDQQYLVFHADLPCGGQRYVTLVTGVVLVRDPSVSLRSRCRGRLASLTLHRGLSARGLKTNQKQFENYLKTNENNLTAYRNPNRSPVV